MKKLQKTSHESHRSEHISGSNFNRGQTISGLKKENSQRLENRRLVIRRRKIGSFFVGLIVASSIIAFILFQIVINVNFTDQDGKKISDNKSLQEAVSRYYDSQPTERLRYFLDKPSLLAEIQKTNPEVADISSIKMNSISNYTFELKMRQPVAVWEINGNNLYVDDKGVAFAKNYYKNPELSILDESGISAKTGKVIASSNFIGFIGRVVAAANSNGLKIEKVVIPPASLRQVQVNIEGIKYPIKLLTTSSAEGQINILVKAIRFFEQQGETPQYLDLRVEGKAYYK